jgi:hypothetical protein
VSFALYGNRTPTALETMGIHGENDREKLVYSLCDTLTIAGNGL